MPCLSAGTACLHRASLPCPRGLLLFLLLCPSGHTSVSVHLSQAGPHRPCAACQAGGAMLTPPRPCLAPFHTPPAALVKPSYAPPHTQERADKLIHSQKKKKKKPKNHLTVAVKSSVLEVRSWSGKDVPVNLCQTNVFLCSDKKGPGAKTQLSPSLRSKSWLRGGRSQWAAPPGAGPQTLPSCHH